MLVLIKAGQVCIRCSSVRYSVNGPRSNLMWFCATEKKKKIKLIHILVPNSPLNAVVCSSWLHLLILVFPASSFRLLLRSCYWESQWDWSVILWQITTTLVGLLAISVSAGLFIESTAGIPGWSMGSRCTLCCLLQGWQPLVERWCGQGRVVLPEPFGTRLAVFRVTDSVQKLCIHVAM